MRLGVIGLGGRIDGMIKWVLAKVCDDFEIAAIADINEEGTRKKIKAAPEVYNENIPIYADADEMLEKEQLDGVFVGTRCSLHTKMALKVIEKGIPLFLEKPVSTTMDDILLLNEARKKYNPKAIVSFPLRESAIVRLAREIVESGKIGTVEQVQAFCDIPYGACYFQSWYRDNSETGGQWLQKATHDLDVINYIVGNVPIKVCAANSTQIFKGDMPYDLECKDCDRIEICPESPLNLEERHGTYCSYSEGVRNEDNGSAIFIYNSGMHAAYSQNFFVRNKAGRRGGRYYGYKGTIEFDWYKGELIVYMHHTNRVDTYSYKDITDGHFGGDDILMKKFANMARGKEVKSTLIDGLQSAAMCYAAKESCINNQFTEISNLT